MAGIFAPHVRGPPSPWHWPRHAASQRVSQALLQQSCCFLVAQAPRSPAKGGGCRHGAKATEQTAHETGLARVAVKAGPEHLVRSSPGMEPRPPPPGWSPPSRDISLLPLAGCSRLLKEVEGSHVSRSIFFYFEHVLELWWSGFLAVSHCSTSGSLVVVRGSPRRLLTGFVSPLERLLSAGDSWEQELRPPGLSCSECPGTEQFGAVI